MSAQNDRRARRIIDRDRDPPGAPPGLDARCMRREFAGVDSCQQIGPVALEPAQSVETSGAPIARIKPDIITFDQFTLPIPARMPAHHARQGGFRLEMPFAEPLYLVWIFSEA
jgi:hypothetical protein